MPLYNIKHVISRKPKWGVVLPKLNIASPYPLFLLMHITLSCDQKCAWCYQRSNEFYASHNMDMEVGSFENILAGFGLFRPHIHIYGGEPLLHPDFPKFLESCRIYGYRPTLTTNGKYLDKYSGIIRKSVLSQINISLNGFLGPDDKVCRESENILRVFVNANNGAKKINLNYAVGFNNCAYLPETVAHFNDSFRKGDFSYFVIEYLMPNASTAGLTNDIPDIRKFSKALKQIKNMRLKFKLLFLPELKEGDLEAYYATNHPFLNKCYIPWLGLSVLPDATVTPGGGVLECNSIVGNLCESSLMNIWKGPVLNDFRLGLMRQNLPQSCNRCCHKLYY